MEPRKNKICLVCSSGGHFMELFFLKEFWKEYEHFWVTFEGEDTDYLLKNERVFFAYSPTNRHVINFIRNIFLSIKILRKERPKYLVTTGAGVGVPFLYIAKLLRIKTVFIETLSRVKKLSLSGKLVYYVADVFIVQWPELAEKYSKALYRGKVL